uniref:Uncharacterized protein n=1 Tax=Megaselia scalaris TaxID=36166 RepID=T1H3W7_MEGSC
MFNEWNHNIFCPKEEKTVIVITSAFLSVGCLKFEEKFSWVNVEYNWPSEEVHQEALASKEYIPEHNVIWRNGVASGLNYIELPSNEMSPKLNPYPSWNANLL